MFKIDPDTYDRLSRRDTLILCKAVDEYIKANKP